MKIKIRSSIILPLLMRVLGTANVVCALVLLVGLCASHAATITATSSSGNHVQNAINAASRGDTVIIPAGTNVYSSPVFISKGLTIVGSGTNSTQLQNSQTRIDGQEQPVFQISGMAFDDAVDISGVYFKGLVFNDGTSIVIYSGTPHLTKIKIHDCIMESFRFGMMVFGADGVVWHNFFLNNRIEARIAGYANTAALGGSAPPPYAWNSLRTFVFEDNEVQLIAQSIDTYISDTQYPANYTWRHNRFDIDRSGVIGVDGHDMHNWNDTNQVFALGIHIYKNDWFITGNTTVNPMNLAGIRGGQGSLVYSNTVHGLFANVDLSCNPFLLPLLTNTYIWGNLGGASGTTPSSITAENSVSLGVNYFTNAPSDFAELAYPHPLRITDPSITAQPTNMTVFAGQSALFTVTATGLSSLTYQWQTNGVNAGTNGPALSLSSCLQVWSGMTVFVTASDTAGAASSSTAILTVNHDPAVVTPPQSLTVQIGQNATWTVSAVGLSTLHYQWKRNGTAVGTDSASFSLSNCQLVDSGAQITVDVTDTAGTVTSSPVAVLTVSGQAPPTKHTFGAHSFGGGTH